MSIKLNNKVIAGKYKEQVIPNADTINKGIAKIATQEEINSGTDNTTIVTPLYLSQKQDKLITGEGINITDNVITSSVKADGKTLDYTIDNQIEALGVRSKNGIYKYDWIGTTQEYENGIKNQTIDPEWYCYITDDERDINFDRYTNIDLDNLTEAGKQVIINTAGTGGGGGTGNPDNTTISINDNDQLQAIGVLEKNRNGVKYDWVGTLAEYNAQNIKVNHPEWVCYITDDITYIDDNKANTTLDNLTPDGEKHFLGNRNITNCITEIPQDIKYTFENNILTILTGSIITVPYGKTNLGLEVGSTFLNDNFKVYKTYFDNGNYFVQVKMQSNLVSNSYGHGSNDCAFCISISTNEQRPQKLSAIFSSNNLPTESSEFIWYDLTNNNIKHYYNNQLNLSNISFPILTFSRNEGTYTSINQVFNGFGYIGSTVFALPNVKGLAPNGRNEDGSLKSIVYTNDKVKTRTFVGSSFSRYILSLSDTYDEAHLIGADRSTDLEYNQDLNTLDKNGVPLKALIIGQATNNEGKGLLNFEAKQPFHALDYNDGVKKSGDTMTGDLYISSNHSTVYLQSNEIAIKEPSGATGNTYLGDFRFLDKNGEMFSTYNCLKTDSNTHQARLWLVGASGKSHYFAMSATPTDEIILYIDGKRMPYIQEYKTNSNGTWYRKWSDGWLEQGGHISTTGGDVLATVTFLKPYKDTNYQVITQPLNSAQKYQITWNTMTVQKKTTTNFKKNVHKDYPIDWYSCGQGA